MISSGNDWRSAFGDCEATDELVTGPKTTRAFRFLIVDAGELQCRLLLLGMQIFWRKLSISSDAKFLLFSAN